MLTVVSNDCKFFYFFTIIFPIYDIFLVAIPSSKLTTFIIW